jgi:hypothetical protein
MNLYGFANGDPVNFSDPFGLCPPEITGRPCGLGEGLKVFAGNFVAGMGAMPGDAETGPGWRTGALVSALMPGLGRGGGAAFARAPATAMGRSIQSLKEFLDEGVGAWQRTSSHAEAATGRAYRGGTSIEEVFVNQDTGQQLVRHTIMRDDEILHETFRNVARFGGHE